MIIAIEGIDASGKATQAKLLTASMNAVLFSFPNYKSITGQIIKERIMSGEYDPIELQALMICNRLELIPAIRVASQSGNVVMDRYTTSGVIYSRADGAPKDWVELVHKYIVPAPDAQVLIDIPIELSVERRPERRDAYERNLAKLEQIRHLYLEYFREKMTFHETSYLIVDGSRSVEEVHEEIKAFTARFLAWTPPKLQGDHR